MNRRTKVELFEEMRREYEFGIGTITGVAQKFGVHRRMVRQALTSAVPPERKQPIRESPKLAPVQDFIDRILAADRQVSRKQRHTAHRIFVRIGEQFPGYELSERMVRYDVARKKREMGLARATVCIPQQYAFGVEGQVDWYEAAVEWEGEQRTLQFFAMRSMASGAAFHRAYQRATQQAFLEAHERAFEFFGGVFKRLRYDNLTSAVKKILRGHQRQETERFLAFRSHWQFESSFCNPAQGHEKGGVEGEVGRFRRNHLVPIPHIVSLDGFNEWLLERCRRDQERRIEERALTVGAAFEVERATLLPLPPEPFDLIEERHCRVDGKGCVLIGTNWYSTPLVPGMMVRVRVSASRIEVQHQGRRIAEHIRCYGRRQQLLELEHYLEALHHKPGAFAGSQPLERWRAEGRWTAAHDRFWQGLQQRNGVQEGTRLMIELLQFGRIQGYDRLTAALEQALALGVADAAAVRYWVSAAFQPTEIPPALPVEDVKRVDFSTRPLPVIQVYDQLLTAGCREVLP